MDISYIWTREGWLYLAPALFGVIDLFARRVVGWATGDRLHRDLALAALRKALIIRCPPEGLIHHSGRGSQYCSIDYQAELRRHGIVISMSGKPVLSACKAVEGGNCYDNFILNYAEGAMVEACPIIPQIIGCCALQNHQNRDDLAHQVQHTR